MKVRALYDFVADPANGELSFREGDIIDVTSTVRPSALGWCSRQHGTNTPSL